MFKLQLQTTRPNHLTPETLAMSCAVLQGLKQTNNHVIIPVFLEKHFISRIYVIVSNSFFF